MLLSESIALRPIASPQSFHTLSSFGWNGYRSGARGCPTSVLVTPQRKSVLLYEMKPLASEGDWTAFLDEDGTGLVYYFNGKTGESVWEPPTPTFPSVKLMGSMRRKALEKQEQYVRAAAQLEEEEEQQRLAAMNTDFMSFIESDDVGLPSGATSPTSSASSPTTSTTATTSSSAKEQDDWFGFLYEYRNARQQQADEALKQTPPKERFAGFLGRMFAKPEPDTAPAIPDVKIPQQPITPTVVKEEEVYIPSVEAIPLEMSSYVLPHPSKIRWGGEDAVFTKGRSFGVMDGVSGAVKREGVPLYSKVLAEELKNKIGEDGLDVRSMTKCLAEAAEIADSTATGASTAMVGSISKDGFLRVLNLGDSTCVVVRDGKVAAKSREISHYFDCPYQLSVDSPDRPRDGTKMNLELLKGDVVVMASDGVFDNMTEEQVAELVGVPSKPPAVIAKRIAEQARKLSSNKLVETPYAKMAQRFGDADYLEGLGGKVDDISCIAVRYG